jgi:hypothetical protein
MSNLILEAPVVRTEALEDDGRAVPMFVSSWVGNVHFPRTLVDGGSLVELLAERVVQKLNLTVHKDEGREISLADNSTALLQRYVLLPVNVSGVLATLKCYLINVTTYDLLLGVRWMRQVRFAVHYGTGIAGISGADGLYVELPHEMAPIETYSELPIVNLEEEDVNDVLQRVIDEDSDSPSEEEN